MAPQSITIRKYPKRLTSPHRETEIILFGLTPSEKEHGLLHTSKSAREAAFDGAMRSNMFKWFDWVGISEHFGLEDKDSLFVDPRFSKRVYIASLIYDTVSYNGRNWSGTPKPWSHELLYAAMEKNFERLASLKKGCLIIPFGDVVSKAISDFSDLNQHHFVLHGFPHPSGANGHRNIKWEESKHRIQSVFRQYVLSV